MRGFLIMFRTTDSTTIKPPAYTVRMLLDHIKSSTEADIPKLKPFSHFTLACTVEDEALQVAESFKQLATYFESAVLEGGVSFKAETVVNLSTDAAPLWGVKLALGSTEEALRDKLGQLFDSMMSNERNGVRYLWKSADEATKRCPHITIGLGVVNEEIARKLVALQCEFIFNQVDYKKVGPHDPHVSKTLDFEDAELASKFGHK